MDKIKKKGVKLRKGMTIVISSGMVNGVKLEKDSMYACDEGVIIKIKADERKEHSVVLVFLYQLYSGAVFRVIRTSGKDRLPSSQCEIMHL